MTSKSVTGMPQESREPSRIQGMFDKIAGRYDLLNHLLSLNLDRLWRRRAAREALGAPEGPLLDLCGGTGDFSLALSRVRPADPVICADFSREMLAVADKKFQRKGVADRCRIQLADALDLPFEDASFAAISIGFGVRNLADMDAGFEEFRRVLVPGGRLIVLEFSQPTAPGLKQLYRTYLRRILPKVGDGVSGKSGPYRYLASTIAEFPTPEILAQRIESSGFSTCRWYRMTGGIVAVHVATR